MKQKSGPVKQPAEGVVRDLRRATRRQFSAEEKIRIVLEGLRGEESIAELCRREMHLILELRPWHITVYPEPVGPGWPAAAEGYERYKILKEALAEAEKGRNRKAIRPSRARRHPPKQSGS